MTKNKRRVLLVTGLSGAGLSTALKMLEDLGYKAIDNLPLALADPLLKQKKGGQKPVAIGIDSRAWDFSASALLEKTAYLKNKKDMRVSLVFITCDDNILQRRFTETRRVHPLAAGRPVASGIALEKKMMRKVKKAADHVIDTSAIKAHDLRRLMAGHFRLEQGKKIFVSVISFGFKNGLPQDADLVFDVRFLDNPHWNKKLRPLSGLDKNVAVKIAKDKSYEPFFQQMTTLIAPLMPRYYQGGKNYLTIAFGCTGGRHRSVFTAHEMHKWLKDKGYPTSLYHRDIDLHPVKKHA